MPSTVPFLRTTYCCKGAGPQSMYSREEPESQENTRWGLLNYILHVLIVKTSRANKMCI